MRHEVGAIETVRRCSAPRGLGFASDDGELHGELHSTAVPIADRSGDVMMAIGITDARCANVAKHVTIIEAAAQRLLDSCDR